MSPNKTYAKKVANNSLVLGKVTVDSNSSPKKVLASKTLKFDGMFLAFAGRVYAAIHLSYFLHLFSKWTCPLFMSIPKHLNEPCRIIEKKRSVIFTLIKCSSNIFLAVPTTKLMDVGLAFWLYPSSTAMTAAWVLTLIVITHKHYCTRLASMQQHLFHQISPSLHGS